MGEQPVTLASVDAQEQRLAQAFAAGDIWLARDLYHPEVVYLSPTTRLYGRQRRIQGVQAALEFIQLTTATCRNIAYAPDERALLPDGSSAYVRVKFDWDADEVRLRSTYVVLYRYRQGLIAGQELYYDPSGELEVLGEPTRS